MVLISAVSVAAGYINLTIVVPFIGNELITSISKDHITIATQFALGFALATIRPGYWLLFSSLTGALPLTISIVGILTKIEEHNLWPIELFFGLAYVIPAIAGAAVAWNISRRQLRKNQQTE